MAGFAFFQTPRCRAAAGAFLAGAALILVAAASPASAQYYSPFDYGYGPPPFPDEYYRPRPYRPAPSRVLPQSDVGALLRSMGFAAITPARRVGDHYVADATDGDGVRVRIRLNRYSGQIASVRPLARGERPLTPPANVRTPAPPKPTPAKPALPQTAARPAPDSQQSVPDAPPATAPAPQRPATPATSEQPNPAASAPATPNAAASPPAADAAPPAPATTPQGVPPASGSRAAAVPPAAPAEVAPPVRVIPGVAVPPSAAGEPPRPPAPAATNDAAISAGLGAGTATPGDSVSAGTASVLTRDAAKPAAKSGKEKKPSVN